MSNPCLSSFAYRFFKDAEKVAQRVLSRLEKQSNGCWEWQGARINKAPYGYGEMHTEGKVMLTHRLVWLLLVGEIPNGLHVLHHCDNPPCGALPHLFLGTPLDNALDKVRKGRDNPPRGEAVWTAKLTPAKVIAIRARFKPWSKTDGVAAMAREFGFSETGMRAVIKGGAWAWL